MKEYPSYLVRVFLDENGVGEAIVACNGHGLARIPIQAEPSTHPFVACLIGTKILDDVKLQQQIFADRPADESPRVSPPIPEPTPEEKIATYERLAHETRCKPGGLQQWIDRQNQTVVIPHGDQKPGIPDTIVGHLFNQKTRQIDTIVHTFNPTNEPLINPDLSVVERQQDGE